MFAVFVAWFLMVVAQQFAVVHSSQLYDQGLLADGASPTQTTTVGLTVFSGWLLALPYCGVLLLVRLLLERIGVFSPDSTGSSAADGLDSHPEPQDV